MNEKDLQTNSRDYLVSILKSLVGAIPYAGTLASEIIGNSIPKQRMDRIANYLIELSNRVETLENNHLKWLENLKQSKSNLLIFELAVKYALETNYQIMYNSYASVVFNAVKNNDQESIINEKILRSISELSGEEIIWLIWFSEPAVLFGETQFYKKFSDILKPHSRSTGNSEKDRLHNALQDQYILNLYGKGLLYRKNAGVAKGTLSISSGDKAPELKDFSITPYGKIVVNALYNEEFFGKNTK